ncbi:hypothetical protein [Variovorax sp. Sphag1AA]|uniref:hypothetical protein n=1 Tax=Variovorax sp. Sphag1AA TaxID=2587027 RepID=UPI0016182137|nr:hypothetical protein [Variovorax sp. Sphag1AA]MBB3181823.1 hypothetical protein [Variovorax sp. Sphag1AA]
MIFDSKRRQSAELEAEEATALAEAPRAGRAVAPDDLQASPPGAMRRVDEEVYQTEAPPVERMNARIDPGHAALRSSDADDLEPLFSTDAADDFRRGWDAVQIGFVDDPRKAVKDADELVNRVLHSLSETFRGERGRLEAQVTQADSISTEDLRMALRRYRSFLHRLLSL